MKYSNYLQYNSVLILSYSFISLGALWLDKLSAGKTNKWFFSSYRSSIWNPMTYVRDDDSISRPINEPPIVINYFYHE